MPNKKDKIFVAGHNGLVGSAICRVLKKNKYIDILTVDRKKLDLRDQKKVFNFLKKNKPKYIIIAAALVGGISANNKYRADFIYNNTTVQNNLIHSAFLNNIKNLIFLGSSCAYPRECKQPIKEKYLLTGPLEKTNEPYAVAKISGIKMCESYNIQHKTNYKCLMPCNTYGINDNYDLQSSHFFPALIRKIHLYTKKNKKFLELWGTGKPKRELMYVDDVAEACLYFMNKKTKHSLINIGSGQEKTIKQFAEFIIKKINSKLKIKFNQNKLMNGTPRKFLDCTLAKSYGWKSKFSLEKGFFITYNDFLRKKLL